jgi:type IV pilus assembly protein PilF
MMREMSREAGRRFGGLVAWMLVFAFAAALLSCVSAERVKNAEAHYKLGNSHLVVGDNQAAFVEFQKALELDPRNAAVHNAIGVVYLNLSDYRKARQFFMEAVDLDSSYSEAYNNLCYADYNLMKWQEAVESCMEALENPLYLTAEKAYYNLGRAYYRMGEYEKAEQAYQSAVKRFPRDDPNLSLAYYGLALTYNARGMYGEAASAMARAVELDPVFRGDIVRAEDAFRTQKTRDPNQQKDLRDYLEILKY